MKHQLDRRVCIAGIMAIVALGEAKAQTPTSRALDDFGRYIDAAASLFGEFVLGIRNAQAAGRLTPPLRAELRPLANTLRQLYSRQSMLVGDLEDYAAAMRRGEDVSGWWSGILERVQGTGAFVRQVIMLVEDNSAIVVVLTPERQTVLSDVLDARVSLLQRLSDLPAPDTSAELTQLEGLNARYRDLIRTLSEVRVTLDEALAE